MEPEPLAEPERRIEAFDVDAQQPARRCAKSEDGACTASRCLDCSSRSSAVPIAIRWICTGGTPTCSIQRRYRHRFGIQVGNGKTKRLERL